MYEHVSNDFIVGAASDVLIDINDMAKILVDTVYQLGSTDNLTAQIVRIDSVPSQDIKETVQQLIELSFLPIWEVRANFDGFKIVRNLYVTSQSHVYLAKDNEAPSSFPIVIKTPFCWAAIWPRLLRAVLLEEWIAKRIIPSVCLNHVS